MPSSRNLTGGVREPVADLLVGNEVSGRVLAQVHQIKALPARGSFVMPSSIFCSVLVSFSSF